VSLTPQPDAICDSGMTLSQQLAEFRQRLDALERRIREAKLAEHERAARTATGPASSPTAAP
jgi:hypothetical protein